MNSLEEALTKKQEEENKIQKKTKIKAKNKKVKTKTIGTIRIYRKDNLYLYLKIPKELESYLAEHLPVRESRSWFVLEGKKEQKAEFYCYIKEIDNDNSNYSPFVKIDSKDNKVKTKKESETTERTLEYTFKNNPNVSQHYLSNNYGYNALYLPDENCYNIAPLRTKGASNGITLICNGLLPPDSATEYVSILGQVIKGLYTMLIAKTDIKAKILLDIEI